MSINQDLAEEIRHKSVPEPSTTGVPLCLSMDGEDDVENIFEDGLLTIFGDVKVSHGEPGEIFQYRTPTG